MGSDLLLSFSTIRGTAPSGLATIPAASGSRGTCQVVSTISPPTCNSQKLGGACTSVLAIKTSLVLDMGRRPQLKPDEFFDGTPLCSRDNRTFVFETARESGSVKSHWRRVTHSPAARPRRRAAARSSRGPGSLWNRCLSSSLLIQESADLAPGRDAAARPRRAWACSRPSRGS